MTWPLLLPLDPETRIEWRYFGFQCDALLRIVDWSNDRLYALNSFSALAETSTSWAFDFEERDMIRIEGELEQ